MNSDKIDINKALEDIENFLRKNIMYILKNKYGNDWEKHLGVSSERLAKWEERAEEEKKRLNGNVIENRKIFYSDFFDLKTIIINNWEIFNNCFENKKILEYQLSQLESFRNPNAHNRDLLDYQKHLLIGYIGEIKLGIMKYRGNIEKQSTFFPEYDSLNINGIKYTNVMISLKQIYRPGDQIDIAAYVTAPNTQKLYYCIIINKHSSPKEWTDSNKFKIQVDNKKIGRNNINIYYKSDATYHLHEGWDGIISITYTVLDETV